MFDIDALNWADAFWEIERLCTRKWFSCVPTTALLPHYWGIETLLNCCPD